MNLLEAKQDLARKLGIDYDELVAGNNGLFTEDDVESYVDAANREACDRWPWPMLEKAKELVLGAGDVTNGYVDYPDDVVSDSIYLLKVNGLSFKKIDWQSYQKFQEGTPNATDRFFSDWVRFVFFNPNAVSAGQTVLLFGKGYAPKLTSPTDRLLFAPNAGDSQHSGNEAITQLAFSIALASDKKKNPQKAASERKTALDKIDAIWAPIATKQSSYQSKDRPYFEVPDFFGKGQSTTPGTF